MDYAGNEPEIQRLECGIYPPGATNRGSFISLFTFFCCYLPKSYISDQYDDEGRSTVTTLSDRYTQTILSVRSYNQNLARDSGVESRAIGGIFI
jgi:hypothetical protein